MPSVAEPPTVPFTAHVTAVLELPDTVAVNGNESPARMFAVVGETTTETDAGVDGVVELPALELAEPPPHPHKIASDAIAGSALASGRIAVRHTSDACYLGTLSDVGTPPSYWPKGKKKGSDQAPEIVECRDVNPLSRDTSIALRHACPSDRRTGKCPSRGPEVSSRQQVAVFVRVGAGSRSLFVAPPH